MSVRSKTVHHNKLWSTRCAYTSSNTYNMRFTLVFACLLVTGVAAKEKQIKLEDIERDNLANERKGGSGSYEKPTGGGQYHPRPQVHTTPAPKMQYGFVPMKTPPNYAPQPQQQQFAHYSTQTENYPQHQQQAYTYSQQPYEQVQGYNGQAGPTEIQYLTQAQLQQYVQSQPEFQTQTQYVQAQPQVPKPQYSYSLQNQGVQSQQYQEAQTQQLLTQKYPQTQQVPTQKYTQTQQVLTQTQQYAHAPEVPTQKYQYSSAAAQNHQNQAVQYAQQYQPQVQYVPQQPIQYIVDNHIQQTSAQPQKYYQVPQYVYVQPNQAASNSIQSVVDPKGNVQYVMYVPANYLKGDPNYESLLQSYPATENLFQQPETTQGDVKYAEPEIKYTPQPPAKYTHIQYTPKSGRQPTSLLDSYVPSYLQYQYYKQQQQESGNAIKSPVKISGGSDLGKSELLKAYKGNAEQAGSQLSYRLQHPAAYAQHPGKH